MTTAGGDELPRWTFLTDHFLVLLCIARDPDMRVRDMALAISITERWTQAILKDLSDAGYVDRIRVGRRTHYRVRREAPLRQPLVSNRTVGALIDALDGGPVHRSPPPNLAY